MPQLFLKAARVVNGISGRQVEKPRGPRAGAVRRRSAAASPQSLGNLEPATKSRKHDRLPKQQQPTQDAPPTGGFSRKAPDRRKETCGINSTECVGWQRYFPHRQLRRPAPGTRSCALNPARLRQSLATTARDAKCTVAPNGGKCNHLHVSCHPSSRRHPGCGA